MSQLPILFVLLRIVFLPACSSTTLTNIFNFTSFSRDHPIKVSRDCYINNSALELTYTYRPKSGYSRTGQGIYANPIKLYDVGSGFAADFETTFTFEITPVPNVCRGDGLAFFITNSNWTSLPLEESSAGFGVYNLTPTAVNRQMVAVEFDTWKNDEFDPDDNHMGIDVNSWVSNVTVNLGLPDADSWPLQGTCLIRYNSTTGTLGSRLRYQNNTRQSNASLAINLTTVLSESVVMGFSAATGDCIEGHRIFAWSLSATLPPNSSLPSAPNRQDTQNKRVIFLVILLLPLLILVAGTVLVVIRIITWKKKKVKLNDEEEEEDTEDLEDMDMNFETGPRKFRYGELVAATNDFSEEGKLGHGGFGCVYRGTLKDTNEVVAVKRFSQGSSQGKKEYMAEVTVISQLRHRNLVRLIGWCHKRGEFLLVYEYMEGGSLDSHLFGSKGCLALPWAHRRKVVLGLASAVLYLHEEWKQCVVHRDIKLSNVMIDSEFNAHLGDFGLARLTTHGFATRTTVIAGTMGYLAPECVITGKASTESDVYSFGVVLLEIATGRAAFRPIGGKEVRLVEWIWQLYGVGSLMEAVDERLGSEFDQQEMERTMVVGLWCVHTDPERRPTIREAIRVLSFQAEIPSLPRKMPTLAYALPPMDESKSHSSGTTATSSSLSSTKSPEAALLSSRR